MFKCNLNKNVSPIKRAIYYYFSSLNIHFFLIFPFFLFFSQSTEKLLEGKDADSVHFKGSSCPTELEMFSRPGPIRRTVAFCPLTIHCLSLRFPRLYKSVIERLSPFPKHWNIFCSSKTPLLPLKYGGVYRLLAYKRKSSRFTSHSLLQLLSSTLRYFVIDNF